MDNSEWASCRSNLNVRSCTQPDAVTQDAVANPANVTNISRFYPAGLTYGDSQHSSPDPTKGNSSTHMFSWVTPNWGHCTVDGTTI